MMASPKLQISDTLSLPLELAARTQCIFAQKGAGKTYAAGVMCEEMLGAGVQVVVLDPTGVWWGLQSSADGGKSPYEIIVMGGGHADVPLEPESGEIIANFLVETGQSVVLDVSQFESQAAQDRFALALATKLYRLKAHDKANIHIFLDEADQFCPLRPQKGQERLLHSWDMIVRQGRSRGLGLTAISQRPAVVHTNIRNNVDLLTCLRVTGLQDFKALKEWTGINATPEQAREFLETVPTLPDGEAWFWSPSWLKIFQRAKVRKKHTFDSSRTPRPGERAVVPKARRAPDLTKLTEQIRASVERAKMTDPKELQRKVRELQGQLAAASAQRVTAAPQARVEIRRVEVPVLKDGQIKRLEDAVRGLQVVLEKAGDQFQRAVDLRDGLIVALKAAKQPAGGAVPVAPAAPPRPVFAAARPSAPKSSPRVVAPARPAENGDATGITSRQQRMLDAAAALTTLGVQVTRETVSGWLGIHPRGGSVGEELKALADAGMIVHERGVIAVTGEGMAAAEPLDPSKAIDRAKAGLSNRQAKIFGLVVAVYPEPTTREAIAEAMNIHPRGGSLGEDISRLVGRGLIEGGRGSYRVRDFLFAGAVT